MTKLIFALCNFANAHKKWLFPFFLCVIRRRVHLRRYNAVTALDHILSTGYPPLTNCSHLECQNGVKGSRPSGTGVIVLTRGDNGGLRWALAILQGR